MPTCPLVVRILVVDDHPFFRDGLLAWIARQKNFESCGQADAPLAALRAIRECQPDIVLLDLLLRGGDGLEVLRELGTWETAPRVIVITNSADTVAAQRALRAGARGYILKEEVSDVLLTAISVVLEGGVHVSGAIRFSQNHSLSVPAPSPALLRNLCHREHQVLQLLGQGHTTKEIADELVLSPKTVEFYREALKRKLEVTDSLALVRFATIWEYEGRLGYLRS